MIRTALTLTLALTAACEARAQTELPINGIAGVDLLGGYDTPEGRMIAARIRLAPGWKTYWRAPGGNGIPPRFDWTGSQNIADATVHWPAPGIFVADGVRTIGYANELVLPILLTVHDPDQAITVAGRISFGVCEDICVPVEAKLSASFAPGMTDAVGTIHTALDARPTQLPVDSAACTVATSSDGATVGATVRSAQTQAEFIVLEYPDPEVWVDTGPTTSGATGLRTEATFYALGDTPLVVDPTRIRLTVLGGAEPKEITGCPTE